MRPVAHRENLLRSETSAAAVNLAKAECDHGHPFSEENTYVYKGERACKACLRNNKSRWRQANRERENAQQRARRAARKVGVGALRALLVTALAAVAGGVAPAQVPDSLCRTLTRVDADSTTRVIVMRCPLPVVVPPAPTPTPIPVPVPTPSIAAHPITAGVAALAELPRAQPPAWSADPSCSITVTTDLQNAVNAARGGDDICLVAGTVYSLVTLTLPARADTGRVTIRTAHAPGWIAPGNRITRTAPMAVIQGTGQGVQSIVKFAPGSRGWRFLHVEIRPDPAKGPLAIPNALIEVAATNSLATLPRDIAFDRVYVHASPTQNTQRCADLSGIDVTFINSRAEECHGKGFESQAILLWGGAGPFLIANNTLEGSGENLMSGGLMPLIKGLTPADAWIHSNHFNTPLEWWKTFLANDPPGSPTGPTRWTKKNIFEIKNAERFLIEGNVFSGSWSDAQTGAALMIKAANNSVLIYDWATAAHITIRDNLIKHASSGIDIDGIEGCPGCNVIKNPGHHITVYGNALDSLAHGPYLLGNQRCYWVGNNVSDLTMDGDVCVGSGLQRAIVAGNKQPNATRWTMRNMSFPNTAYGIIGCSNTASPWTGTCFTDRDFSGNVIRGPQRTGYPSGIAFDPTATPDARLQRVRALTAKVVQP